MSWGRRTALVGAACALGCTTAQAEPGLRCDALTSAPAVALSAAEQERHALLSLLAMALVFDGWSVDRSDPAQLAAYRAAAPGRSFPDYGGHHVAAVLADAQGRVLCAALNRNVALNSTLAHAEARAVARAIELGNAASPPRWSFGRMLAGMSLYTTLEPCAQCSGIMDLASLGRVVFAQDDPGQEGIATILYNLRRSGGGAMSGVLPIRARFTPFWDRLASGYASYLAEAGATVRPGVTSYLQTVAAYHVFRDAASSFEQASAQAAANRAVLTGAQAFRLQWQAALRDAGLAPG